MNTTWYEKGIDQGRREMLRDQLEARFGRLSPTVLERLEQLSREEVKALGKKVLQGQSLQDLGLEE
jgi:hypothetical protein